VAQPRLSASPRPVEKKHEVDEHRLASADGQETPGAGTGALIVNPDRIRHFGPTDGAAFCLVTNPGLVEKFAFGAARKYSSAKIVALPDDRPLHALFGAEIPESSHVLVISPEKFLTSPEAQSLGRRKLIVMPCASTPCGRDAIAHFLAVVERSDPEREAAFVDRFFKLGEASDRLEFVDDEYGTRAVLKHLDESYEWNVQAALLDWGDQQIAPSGEISVVPGSIMEFDPSLALALDGEIALKGALAVHCGAVSYYEPDRSRLFESLSTIREHAVVVRVREGRIAEVRATHRLSEPAAEALTALIEIDSRYATIWECGFGINAEHVLFGGNCGMNESYGGPSGCCHWGLGLTPFTQYALIILCPQTRALGKDGAHLAGPALRGTGASETAAVGMGRVKKGPCGCYPS